LGPYELGERLGSGGMAEVYIGRRAGPRGFQKRFAIKRILPQLAADSRFVEMFCDEARICAALTHPNIVQVVDFGEHDGELFMAMEYVDGVSLARLLRAVASRGERFPVGVALFIVHEVLRGLRYAHEARDEQGHLLGIVHRDVSPGNILVGRAGEVKLTDFGIVLSAFVDRRTYPGELKGKMGYMSPEQVIGEELDARSDLFTVGIVLAEMLLARPLFPGRNELEMLSRMYEADLAVLERGGGALPCELVGVLRTALARSRDQRFQSARDFEDAVNDVARRAGVSWSDSQLGAWLGGLGLLPPAVHLEAPPAPPPEQHPAGRRPTPPARHMTPPRLVLMPQGAQYSVRAPGGAPVGPVSLSDILGGIATGELPPATEVAEEGGEWQPLGAVGVFGTLTERAPFRFHDPLDARVTWRRELSRQRWPGILFSLVRQRETGLMVVRSERRQKRVFWETGAPRFVSSTDRSELLGARLVAAGLLDIGDLDRTVMFAAERGQRLGEMLVALGILRPTALLRALIDQLETRFIELGGWHSGEVLFVRGERTAEDRVASRASGLALVGRTLHEGYSDIEIAGLLAPFMGSPIARLPSRVEIGELGLTPAQRRALELAPGAASLQALMTELARNAGARHPDSLRGVFTGLCCGLLVTPGWPTMA
jgi:eukaryotic-like serine/threonine-protein kinase